MAERSDALMVAVYDELRALASAHLRHERRGHTLQTTALVHEAYLRIAARGDSPAASREQFFAIAAQAIRRILIDHARSKATQKRAAGRAEVELDAAVAVDDGEEVDVLELDRALAKLERLNERQARIVELRFFAGLEMDEVARTLGIAPRTAALDWKMAKAWLHAELERSA
jgi:RNA polymerase sigma factor (TIGR02999 family)